MEEFFSVLEISRGLLEDNECCELVYVNPL